MKRNQSNLWLTLSLVLATGCGARTPLDLEEDQSAGPVGGGAASQGGGAGGGTVGFGGSLGAGGMAGLTSRGTGGTVSFGGTRGTLPFGGTGGTVPFGGTRGTLPFGGTGGTAIGGRGGTGGFFPFGGTTVFGGSTGGRGGTGGAIPLGGTVVGGHGGTAGIGGGGGTAGATTCPSLAVNEDLIDNMNDGDRFIPQVNGRAGAWKDSNDATPGSKMFPDPSVPFVMTDTGDVCRQYAAYVHGGPFVDTGAVFGFGLGSPYNAGAYSGITFWAKIDSGTSAGLRVAFPDKDTQPDGGLCQPAVPGPTECWDHYGTRITLTTEWTKYPVYFNSLTQDGWGRKGAGFDRSTIFEVQFEIPVNGTFGIWIDDVAFATTPLLPL